MNDKKEMIEFRNKLIDGLKISFEKLIEFKKYKNTPFIFSENGEIIEVYANELETQQNELRKETSYKKIENVQLVNEPLEKTKREKQ